MSIIFQTIFNLLRKRDNEEKRRASRDETSEAPASRPPRPFYPDGADEDEAEKPEDNGNAPPSE